MFEVTLLLQVVDCQTEMRQGRNFFLSKIQYYNGIFSIHTHLEAMRVRLKVIILSSSMAFEPKVPCKQKLLLCNQISVSTFWAFADFFWFFEGAPKHNSVHDLDKIKIQIFIHKFVYENCAWCKIFVNLIIISKHIAYREHIGRIPHIKGWRRPLAQAEKCEHCKRYFNYLRLRSGFRGGRAAWESIEK